MSVNPVNKGLLSCPTKAQAPKIQLSPENFAKIQHVAKAALDAKPKKAAKINQVVAPQKKPAKNLKAQQTLKLIRANECMDNLTDWVVNQSKLSVSNFIAKIKVYLKSLSEDEQNEPNLDTKIHKTFFTIICGQFRADLEEKYKERLIEKSIDRLKINKDVYSGVLFQQFEKLFISNLTNFRKYENFNGSSNQSEASAAYPEESVYIDQCFKNYLEMYSKDFKFLTYERMNEKFESDMQKFIEVSSSKEENFVDVTYLMMQLKDPLELKFLKKFYSQLNEEGSKQSQGYILDAIVRMKNGTYYNLFFDQIPNNKKGAFIAEVENDFAKNLFLKNYDENFNQYGDFFNSFDQKIDAYIILSKKNPEDGSKEYVNYVCGLYGITKAKNIAFLLNKYNQLLVGNEKRLAQAYFLNEAKKMGDLVALVSAKKGIKEPETFVEKNKSVEDLFHQLKEQQSSQKRDPNLDVDQNYSRVIDGPYLHNKAVLELFKAPPCPFAEQNSGADLALNILSVIKPDNGFISQKTLLTKRMEDYIVDMSSESFLKIVDLKNTTLNDYLNSLEKEFYEKIVDRISFWIKEIVSLENQGRLNLEEIAKEQVIIFKDTFILFMKQMRNEEISSNAFIDFKNRKINYFKLEGKSPQPFLDLIENYANSFDILNLTHFYSNALSL